MRCMVNPIVNWLPSMVSQERCPPLSRSLIHASYLFNWFYRNWLNTVPRSSSLKKKVRYVILCPMQSKLWRRYFRLQKTHPSFFDIKSRESDYRQNFGRKYFTYAMLHCQRAFCPVLPNRRGVACFNWAYSLCLVFLLNWWDLKKSAMWSTLTRHFDSWWLAVGGRVALSWF